MTRTSTGIVAIAADASDLAALERAEELRLQRGVEIADLVDEERAAVRVLEDACARRDRAGERAALVTEQLRLDEARRDGRAVEDDERLARARPRLVERLGEHLFARAGLAFDRRRARSRPATRSRSG